MSEQDIITELAKKYLDETAQKDIAERIADNNLPIAKLYVLGAIDNLRIKEKIGDNEANEAFQKLGFGPEKAPEVQRFRILW